MATVTYSLGIPGKDPVDFTDRRKAALAFHAAKAEERPYLLRTLKDSLGRESTAVIGNTSVCGVEGQKQYGKWVGGTMDPEFKRIYDRVCRGDDPNLLTVRHGGNMEDDFWRNGAEQPEKAGRYLVKRGPGDQRMIGYIPGLGWQAEGFVDTWKWTEVPDDLERFDVAPALVFNGEDFQVMEEGDAYEVADALEAQAMQKIVSQSLEDVGIEVRRYFTVADDANTYSAGRVLAIGETYAAQHVGGGDIVLHEHARLSQDVRPGDEVTILYREGQGLVLKGIFHRYDIVLDAPGLSTETHLMAEGLLADEIRMAKINVNDPQQVLEAVRRVMTFVVPDGTDPAEGVSVQYRDYVSHEQEEIREDDQFLIQDRQKSREAA